MIYSFSAYFTEISRAKGVFCIEANSLEEAKEMINNDPKSYLEDVIDFDIVEQRFDDMEFYGDVDEYECK